MLRFTLRHHQMQKLPTFSIRSGLRTTCTRGSNCNEWINHVGRYSTIREIYVKFKIAIIVVFVRLLDYDFDPKDLTKQNTFIGSYPPGTTIAIKSVWRID